ncbi:glycosyltransferase family 4 protein [bacterium]|nr:glycosyltransferase family 4 protein [bacterium]
MMKILNVIMFFEPLTGGGSVERTFQMSRHLVKAGMECCILTTDIGLTPEREHSIKGVKIIALPSLLKRFYVPKLSYRQLKDIIISFDIIHLMNHWTIINALVYILARRLNKPYVICPAGSLPIYGRSKLIKKLYNWVIGRRIIHDASGHIAISSDEIDQFQEYGIVSDKVTLIPNGINGDDFSTINDTDYKKKYGLTDAPFILFVGRLNSIKGPDLLLQAFCNAKDELQPYHLIFVGPDDGMLAQLRQMTEMFDISDRVHFLGYLGGEDKSYFYRAAELLVIPSRKEAMSIVVLEAGISGTPVLLTDKCGLNEISMIGGGFVVTPSVDGVQQGLINIFKDRTKLKSMGANLKKYTYENYLWNAVINKYLKLYQQIKIA